MAVTCALIVEAVSEYYGVSSHDILSARRTRPLIQPRYACFWLSKKMTHKSLPEIGRNLGGRDHTTVIHGIRSINEQIGQKPVMLDELREIETVILASIGVITVTGDRVPEDHDPMAIADRLLNTPLTRQMVSAQELRILANAVLNQFGEDDEDPEAEPTPAPEPLDLGLVEPVIDTLRAFKGWQADRFGAGERAATARIERCLTALKTAFETQFKHKGKLS